MAATRQVQEGGVVELAVKVYARRYDRPVRSAVAVAGRDLDQVVICTTEFDTPAYSTIKNPPCLHARAKSGQSG